MTETIETTLIGYAGLFGRGEILHGVVEVADFIQTKEFGVITDIDGDIVLEFEDCKIKYCNDMLFKHELIAELRKGEGFDGRNWL